MSDQYDMSKFREQRLSQEMRQECPNCREANFEKSENVEILLKCPNCGHTIWTSPDRHLFCPPFFEENLQEQFDDNFIAYDSDHYIWSFTGKKHYTIPDPAFILLHLPKGQRELFLEGCRQGVVEQIKK